MKMARDFLCCTSLIVGQKKFEKLIKIIDDTYMGKSSRRSLEQMRTREIGEPSNSSPPALKFGSHLFLKYVNE